MIKVGIIGGAGYTAGELLRILIYHPEVEIVYVQSTSNAGKPVSSVHRDLFGETGIVFTGEPGVSADVIFLCMGHGKSREFLQNQDIARTTKIIDLSQDFRNTPVFEQDGRVFVYGLPEVNREEIRKADSIANPGCFATAIELALLPLAHAGLLNSEVHVNGVTGSTGAGQAPSDTTHFSWRNNNVSVYKAFEHQHLKEITRLIRQVQPNFSKNLNFIPVRGNFTRGILATAYLDCNLSREEGLALYQEYYKDAVFTHVTSEPISVKEVVNTNKCLVQVEKYGSKLLITSAIDNLTKGASGQAVHNMNLMFGLPEKTGLHLKPVMF